MSTYLINFKIKKYFINNELNMIDLILFMITNKKGL